MVRHVLLGAPAQNSFRVLHTSSQPKDRPSVRTWFVIAGFSVDWKFRSVETNLIHPKQPGNSIFRSEVQGQTFLDLGEGPWSGRSSPGILSTPTGGLNTGGEFPGIETKEGQPYSSWLGGNIPDHGAIPLKPGKSFPISTK